MWDGELPRAEGVERLSTFTTWVKAQFAWFVGVKLKAKGKFDESIGIDTQL
jgi:hypothetical protein